MKSLPLSQPGGSVVTSASRSNRRARSGTAAPRRPRRFSAFERLCRRICLAVAVVLSLLALVAMATGHPLATLSAAVLTAVALCVAVVAFRGGARSRIRVALLSVSCLLSLTLAEVLLRLFTVYPISGNSNVVVDAELGYRLDSDLADVDAAGFRNPVVLTEADVVAIGDSHTQGFNVSGDEAWPSQLSELLDRPVYNFGVGGFGPLHYELLIRRALQLRPKYVIIVYLPNDLTDVVDGIHPRLAAQPHGRSLACLLRDRTAVASLAWQLIRRSGYCPGGAIVVDHDTNPTRFAKTGVSSDLRGMDLQNPAIDRAARETVRVLQDGHTLCAEHGTRLLVLLIPSKASVYAAVESPIGRKSSVELSRLASRELTVSSRIARELQIVGIPYAEVRPYLSERVERGEQIYPAWSDGHPLAAGYHAYALAARDLMASTPGGLEFSR